MPDLAECLYPVWKKSFINETGPYATVVGELGGTPDAFTHLFGLWVSREIGDIDLFNRLRNSTDQFAGLSTDPATGAMRYSAEDGLLLNGLTLVTKLHEGLEAPVEP